MKSSTSQPLSLTDFGISPERGFLPSDPCETLLDCPTLNHLGHEMPKLLSARQVRQFIDEQPALLPSIPSNWREDECRAALRMLSFAGHAYVWETLGQPAVKLPSQLARPWSEIAQKLGRPPVLSYASYALDNWRRLDGTKPIQLDNIVLLQNFLGGLDEEWFVVVHIQIEQQAGPGLAGLVRAINAASEGNDDEVLLGLQALASAQTAMRDTLLRMKERCDPYVYYTRVRPYIHGWKNSLSLPDGLIYEKVEAYAQQPQQFRGETGAQSTIVPCLDAGLGIHHAPDPLTVYLQEMREYMPPRHRAFLQALESQTDSSGRARLSSYVHDRRQSHSELWSAYGVCVGLLAQFREIHIGYADSYINRQHQTSTTNPTAVGTGGTPFMTYLQKHLDETKQTIGA
ncbi:MAG: indoleamine 2,3-dioxygenase [Nitrospira sp.]|nr:indoleamine 2,3-dioxygenase [Nitrospira sp.]MDH4370585.1 indoleamine 2,3-dioxygenase [Nitrospira sp.]MDH5497078.1 indoleamine 2,3-dioxygenase [Nitrospira sp.]